MHTLLGLGTDGFTNWVQTPDGQRYNLGPVSVLQLVGELVPEGTARREVLTEFNLHGQALFSGDLDLLWEVLKPRRARWAAGFPFMRTGSQRRDFMNNFLTDLGILEGSVEALAKHASSRGVKGLSPEKRAAQCAPFVERVVLAVEKIQDPALPKSAGSRVTHAWVQRDGEVMKLIDHPIKPGSGEDSELAQRRLNGWFLVYVGDLRKTPRVGDQVVVDDDGVATSLKKASSEELTDDDKLSYDTYKDNSEIAFTILAKAEETEARIASLVSAGKRFNAAKARVDLHAITSKIAGIVSDVDLSLPWVRSDLEKLASRNDELHKMFAGVKLAKK